jgi:hypothetical protein
LRSSANNRELLESHNAIDALRYVDTLENLAIRRILDRTSSTTAEAVQTTFDYWGESFNE